MPITMDPYAIPAKLVKIASPTNDVLIQDLVDEIRDWEDSDEGMAFSKVIDAVGKADLGGSTYTGITMTLSDEWRIQFWSGVGVGVVRGGNLVGGYDSEAIEPTGGSDTVIVVNAVGGVIAVTGSGVTQQNIMDIVDGVWDETKSSHTSSGSFGEEVQEHSLSTEIAALNDPSAADVADAVWDEAIGDHQTADTPGALLEFIRQVEGGRWKIDNNQMIFYEEDNATEVARFNLLDDAGQPSETDVFERQRV